MSGRTTGAEIVSHVHEVGCDCDWHGGARIDDGCVVMRAELASVIDALVADARKGERERIVGIVTKWGDDTFSRGATATLVALILADDADGGK